jgi:hypothetical protein
MTKAHHPPTLRQPTKMPAQPPVACSPHITTRAAARQTTTAAARTPTNKARPKASTDRHRANTVLLKDNTDTEASRCNTSRDRHPQAATTKMTGGPMAAAEACSLDCALVWRAVVAWTACSRQVAVDKQCWRD